MAEQKASAIVDKVWGLCAVLRDDGVSYGYYLEQLTYLIFIKMADEYSKPPFNRRYGVQSSGLLGNWLKQATELCSAYQHDTEIHR